MNVQLETLRKADRVLTRDPEIASLIGSSDDDLLYELRKDAAEEKLGKRVKKDEQEILDMTPPDMPKESPKSAAEILKEKEEQQKKMTGSVIKPAAEEKKMPPQAVPQHTTAPSLQNQNGKPPAKSNLFGAK